MMLQLREVTLTPCSPGNQVPTSSHLPLLRPSGHLLPPSVRGTCRGSACVLAWCEKKKAGWGWRGSQLRSAFTKPADLTFVSPRPHPAWRCRAAWTIRTCAADPGSAAYSCPPKSKRAVRRTATSSAGVTEWGM